MDNAKGTVYVVDSDPELREKLYRLFKSVNLQVRAYAAPQDFFRESDFARPACLISEVRMSGISGLELFRRVRRKGSTMPVIFLTNHADVAVAVEAMRQGAFHFLQKPFSEQQLLDEVYQAIRQDAQNLAEEVHRQGLAVRFKALSERENDILEGIIAGKTSKTMASEFGIAVKTVEFHRANIMKKIGVESVVGLVNLLLKSGWDRRSHPQDGSV